MDNQPQTDRPSIIHQLPKDAYYQLMHTLRATLPPISDTPEDIARRDNAAIVHVACLLPANADEADLAAKYVAAGAHAMECLRLAREHRNDTACVLKCGAQAASMLRQAQATRSLLMRVQAERRKRETDTGTLDGSNWSEHSPTGLMTEALAAPKPKQPEPTTDMTAEADRYALGHRKRAALIRSLGRLPEGLRQGPNGGH